MNMYKHYTQSRGYKKLFLLQLYEHDNIQFKKSYTMMRYLIEKVINTRKEKKEDNFRLCITK